MKVRLSKSSTGAILFALILCQFAKALQHVDLVMCDETADSVPPCILHDSMGDKQYLHENATLILLIKLPVPVLTELWLDYSKIEIVTPSGDILTNGQEIISSQDRDRWTIKFNFERVNSDVGKLHLVLHIRDVEYRDTQLLHVEIKTQDNLLETTEKIWIPVEMKSNEGDNDREGEAANITENPVDHTDPSAFLHARIETLQNKTEVLEKKLMTTENVWRRYQAKYLRCLESKEELTNGTVKPELDVYGRMQKGIDITTLIALVVLLFAACVFAYAVFMIKCSPAPPFKPTEYKRMENDGKILPHSAVTFKDVNSFGELLSTVQRATQDVHVQTQCTGSSQYLQSQNGTTCITSL